AQGGERGHPVGQTAVATSYSPAPPRPFGSDLEYLARPAVREADRTRRPPHGARQDIRGGAERFDVEPRLGAPAENGPQQRFGRRGRPERAFRPRHRDEGRI